MAPISEHSSVQFGVLSVLIPAVCECVSFIPAFCNLKSSTFEGRCKFAGREEIFNLHLFHRPIPHVTFKDALNTYQALQNVSITLSLNTTKTEILPRGTVHFNGFNYNLITEHSTIIYFSPCHLHQS